MPANFLHPWISHIRHGHWLRWWLAALVCAGQCGCVQRRFTVRSNPPGAVVYVDDYEIGTTPVSHDFVYYGTRKIRLVKDGYETLTVMQKFPTPWYQIIGIDFIAENLVPGEIRDERVVDYQLQPQIIVPTEQLLGRAENLRRGTQMVTGVAVPGYRVNPPSPAPGTPGGPPIGGQPYYQLPPTAGQYPQPGPAIPAEPIYTPPPSAAPAMPPGGGPIYQAPPAMPPAGPTGPPNVGSQPYYPLPSGG